MSMWGATEQDWLGTPADELTALRAQVSQLTADLEVAVGERDDALEHLAGVLFSDPGVKLLACRRAATEWWIAFDAKQEATLNTTRKDG